MSTSYQLWPSSIGEQPQGPRRAPHHTQYSHIPRNIFLGLVSCVVHISRLKRLLGSNLISFLLPPNLVYLGRWQ